MVLTLLVSSPFVWAEKGGLISSLEKEKKVPPPPFLPSRIPGRVHTHTLSLGVGQSFLYGGMKNHGEDSITTDLYYLFSASYSFSFVSNLHYSGHKDGREEVKLRGLALGIKGKLWQFDSLSPYLLGGLGFYAPLVKQLKDGGLKKSKNKIILGFHFGTGVDLQLNNKLMIGLLLHYHNPFDIKEDTGQVKGSYGKMLITLSYIF